MENNDCMENLPVPSESSQLLALHCLPEPELLPPFELPAQTFFHSFSLAPLRWKIPSPWKEAFLLILLPEIRVTGSYLIHPITFKKLIQKYGLWSYPQSSKRKNKGCSAGDSIRRKMRKAKSNEKEEKEDKEEKEEEGGKGRGAEGEVKYIYIKRMA